MEKISKLLNKGHYSEVYEFLIKENKLYSIDILLSNFPNCDSKNLFSFMIYSISREETIDKYLTICDLLKYLDQFIDDNDSLIKWFATKAILVFPDSIEMKLWIINAFYGIPTSPFSVNEFILYSVDILKSNPDNELAQKILLELT